MRLSWKQILPALGLAGLVGAISMNCADPSDTDYDGDGYDECDDSTAGPDPSPSVLGGDRGPRHPGRAQSCDCNDLDADVYPGATEVCDDGIDQDCDGKDGCDMPSPTLEPSPTPQDTPAASPTSDQSDLDGDGHSAVDEGGDDCDDTRPDVNPDAADDCDGVDNDCNGTTDDGFDGDADGASPCGPLPDCNDGDGAIYPDASEVCDGKDNDCNGITDEGFDGDGDGVTTCTGDCNDGDSTVYTGATEVCNNIDDNCSGAIDEGFDYDGDGYKVCGADGVPSTPDDDCNDRVEDIHPGATEDCNSVDDDCDGQIDEDACLVAPGPWPWVGQEEGDEYPLTPLTGPQPAPLPF